jgi:hypothetical protein
MFNKRKNMAKAIIQQFPPLKSATGLAYRCPRSHKGEATTPHRHEGAPRASPNLL